ILSIVASFIRSTNGGFVTKKNHRFENYGDVISRMYLDRTEPNFVTKNVYITKLNISCWLLAVGCWLLAVGCWLIVPNRVCMSREISL
ncbi:MAG: hypothetical protein II220_11645, partial [Spirochaetales bacterium]|nr:hypothetical protein [Spirochaetales bacterium]